jgi:hypothetical protein
MTYPPSALPSDRRSRIGPWIALLLLPMTAALGLLLLGLATSTLAFLYLSMAASVVAVPAFVVAVVLLVRG